MKHLLLTTIAAVLVGCGLGVNKELSVALKSSNVDPDRIFLLVSAGSDVNGLDDFNREPLIFELIKGIATSDKPENKLKVLDIFISHGLKVNIYNRGRLGLSGEPITPLHYLLYISSIARTSRNIAALEAVAIKLIENGADVNKRNPDYNTPLGYHSSYGFPESRITRTVRRYGGR